MKGVESVPVDGELLSKADELVLALEQRLNCHIGDRVHPSRQKHWTMDFTRDNLPPMSAAMCLVGHVVGDLDTYSIEDCLLRLPMDAIFRMIDGELSELEGCYLYYDRKKRTWIRSGKTSGEGKKASFAGRGGTHAANASNIDEMREHPFYRYYPVEGANNLGRRKGYFGHLEMRCGMAFDAKGDVSALTSNGEEDSLFVWREQTMSELSKRGGDLKQLQLDAISYLWEICYDIALAKRDNVSVSPGFEAFGLRVNQKKRSREGSAD